MLIRGAELLDGTRADVRISGDRIDALGTLHPAPGESIIDARGGLLLPGLHDHHIHLAALAAASNSVSCGPPDVCDVDALVEALRRPGAGWLRGTGYHESVAGMLDRQVLDRLVDDRPLRIQHRTGRMWFLNSAALAMLLERAEPPPSLDIATGRLFDDDGWLRRTLGGTPPAFDAVSTRLAAYGVTGVTDMSPANDLAMATHFAAEQGSGGLLQGVLLAGRPSLGEATFAERLTLGPVKLHLHEADLPALDDAVAVIRDAHDADRAVAVHCVTQVELLFALAAIEEAGPARDRIEHASVATPDDLARIADLGLSVAAQPHFVSERGDAYLRDVEPEDRPHLYRLQSILDAGVSLAVGSDAPYGQPDPWAAMAAAVSRRTRSGATIGAHEALSPEDALALFLRDPQDFSGTRAVEPGASADLCLLKRPWAEARAILSADLVRATIAGGRLIHNFVDEAPAKRRLRADASA